MKNNSYKEKIAITKEELEKVYSIINKPLEERMEYVNAYFNVKLKYEDVDAFLLGYIQTTIKYLLKEL